MIGIKKTGVSDGLSETPVFYFIEKKFLSKIKELFDKRVSWC